MIEEAPAGPFVIGPQPRLERSRNVWNGRDAEDGAVYFSLIVPTFNESKNIGNFVTAVCEVLDSTLPRLYEVIVVDDNSPDRTWEIAEEAAARHAQIRILRRRDEVELSSAVIRGWQASRGEILGTMNADFQHPPAMLPRMLDRIKTADLVVATRFGDGGSVGTWPVHRRLVSGAAKLAGRLVVPRVFGSVSDPLSGCYMFKRSTVMGTTLHPTGYKTLIEILSRGKIGLIGECGYKMEERLHGRSKLSCRQSLRYLVHLLRLRSASRDRTNHVTSSLETRSEEAKGA